jgi:hypothetical protein
MEPPPPYGPRDVQQFIADDIARWTQFVDAVGIEKLKGEAARQ